MRIAILLPTRRRPENIERLVGSLYATASTIPEVVVYVDEDDSTVSEVQSIKEVKVICGPRCILSDCWNACYKETTADIVMMCGDDIVFRTSNWDKMVIDCFARYPDKIVFVHGEDGYQPTTFGSHGFLHRNWIDAIGYFSAPYFSSEYNDTWLNDVANAINRRVYLPIVTEHMHPIVGKASWDQTYMERVERGNQQNTGQLYIQLQSKRNEDVVKLQNFINANC